MFTYFKTNLFLQLKQELAAVKKATVEIKTAASNSVCADRAFAKSGRDKLASQIKSKKI